MTQSFQDTNSPGYILFERSSQLVRTAGRLDTTSYALKARYHICCLHAFDQLRYAHGISWASTCEFHFIDYARIIHIDNDGLRTCALGLIYGLHMLLGLYVSVKKTISNLISRSLAYSVLFCAYVTSGY